MPWCLVLLVAYKGEIHPPVCIGSLDVEEANTERVATKVVVAKSNKCCNCHFYASVKQGVLYDEDVLVFSLDCGLCLFWSEFHGSFCGWCHRKSAHTPGAEIRDAWHCAENKEERTGGKENENQLQRAASETGVLERKAEKVGVADEKLRAEEKSQSA